MSAAAQPASMPTLWLRRPDLIQQHLEFASGVIQVCVLSVGGQQVFGQMGPPDPVTGVFEFKAHGRLEGIVIPPRPGAPVRVDYEAVADRFAFFSEVLDVRSPLSWRLARPTTVERKDKRLSRRIQIDGDSGFSLHLQIGKELVVFPLKDLSAGGVGFGFDQSKTPLDTGNVLPGTLQIPGHRAVEVKLEIRHVRQNDGRGLAGTRFRQIAYADRMAVRRLVAAWGG
jgi:hypothetical protein